MTCLHSSALPPCLNITCLINARDRQQHQSSPDCLQTQGVTRCHGALSFFRCYLLACFPLGFFFVPMFVLCEFADWCCDNYK